jgi:RimJ/RimL family protein N-acetyltransferase
VTDGGHENRRTGTGLQCAIVSREDDRLIGSVGLRVDGSPRPVAEIGYWISAWARGRGYATEATAALCEWAFRHGTPRVELVAAVGNEASQRVALAAGFRREGLLRSAVQDGGTWADAVLFGRLATDATPTRRFLPDVGRLTDGVVSLRRVRPGDEGPMLEERTDEETRRWSTTPRIWSAEDCRAYVAAAPSLWIAGAEARFAVVDAATDEYTGSVGLRVTVPAFRVGEIGYGLRAAWRGRGYTARALRLVSEWAFDRTALARLELGTAVGNIASQRAAERAGFRREGLAVRRLPTSDGGRTDEIRFGLIAPG